MKWIRPSGSVIELADTENLNEFAKANGWKAVDKVKRTRRTKAQMEEAKNGGRSTSN